MGFRQWPGRSGGRRPARAGYVAMTVMIVVVIGLFVLAAVVSDLQGVSANERERRQRSVVESVSFESMQIGGGKTQRALMEHFTGTFKDRGGN